MSGIEIVGLVLGAIPLVISGLEHYRKGLEKIQAMTKYEETVENLLITFDTTRARYLFTCETLLAPLMLKPDQYHVLINDPSKVEAWADKDLQASLRDRLGIAWNPYVELVKRVHKALLKFAGKMEIEIQERTKSRLPTPASKTSSQLVSTIGSSRVWARVRIGLKSGGLERLLDGMEKDIFRLERLLETSANLPAIRRDRKHRLQKRPWQLVRQSAQSLFGCISKSWQCRCALPHGVLLRLSALDSSKESEAVVKFELLLSQKSLATTFHQSKWHTLEVVSAEETIAKGINPSVALVQRSKVAFMITPPDELTVNLRHGRQIIANGPLISDLKATLSSPTLLGHLSDTSWIHNVSRSTRWSVPGGPSNVARIKDILSAAPSTSTHSQGALSIRQKYQFAVTTAFAVLQLFDTPWLDNYENLHDICLVPGPGPASQYDGYLLKTFAKTSQPAVQRENKMHRVGVQNELLFQLGVLLLEIAYDRPLSKMRLPADLDGSGNETILTDYLVAVRLADEIVYREPSKYSDAVKRCLFCRFTCTSTNLSDAELQEEFFESVVQPLVQLCDVFK